MRHLEYLYAQVNFKNLALLLLLIVGILLIAKVGYTKTEIVPLEPSYQTLVNENASLAQYNNDLETTNAALMTAIQELQDGQKDLIERIDKLENTLIEREATNEKFITAIFN